MALAKRAEYEWVRGQRQTGAHPPPQHTRTHAHTHTHTHTHTRTQFATRTNELEGDVEEFGEFLVAAVVGREALVRDALLLEVQRDVRRDVEHVRDAQLLQTLQVRRVPRVA